MVLVLDGIGIRSKLESTSSFLTVSVIIKAWKLLSTCGGDLEPQFINIWFLVMYPANSHCNYLDKVSPVSIVVLNRTHFIAEVYHSVAMVEVGRAYNRTSAAALPLKGLFLMPGRGWGPHITSCHRWANYGNFFSHEVFWPWPSPVILARGVVKW